MNEFPEKWLCLKLEELVTIKYGKGLSTKDLSDIGYPVFGANGIIGRYPEYLYEDEQVLISCRGAYSGKKRINKSNFALREYLTRDV